MKEYFLKLKNRRGQSALSITILIGGTVVILAVTLAVLIFSFVNSGLGLKHSTQALHGALGGINDALMRITRGGLGIIAGCGSSYSVNLDGTNVNVVLGKYDDPSDATSCGGDDFITDEASRVGIISGASVSNRSIYLSANISVDLKSGALEIISIKQVSIVQATGYTCGGENC